MTSARGLLSIAVLLSAIRDSTETATEDYKSGVAQAASLRYTSRHVRAALRGRPSCQAQVRHLHKEGRPRSNHARINDLIIMKKPLACFAALRSFASFALTYLSFLERIPFSQSSQRTAKLAALGWFLRRTAHTGVPLIAIETIVTSHWKPVHLFTFYIARISTFRLDSSRCKAIFRRAGKQSPSAFVER